MRRTFLLVIALLGGCAGDYPPTEAPPAPAPPHTERLGEAVGFAWKMRSQPETITLEATCLDQMAYEDLKVRILFKDADGKELIGGESLAGGSCDAGGQGFSQEQQAIWPEAGTLDITITLKTAAGNRQARWGFVKRNGEIARQP
ncbi:MAG TPA: hypothetical protein VGE07_05805 [Herpetosiphonaceae bacterium]